MTKVYVKEEDFTDAISLAEAIIDLHAAGYEVFLERRLPQLLTSPNPGPYKSPPFIPTPLTPGWPPTIISNATVSPSVDYRDNPNTGRYHE